MCNTYEACQKCSVLYCRGGESPAAGEERVLPPGRKESSRRGGKSPAAGEERVRPPGRKESGQWGGKSLANGEERVLLPGRKGSCRRGEKEREPPYKRERAREYVTQGEAYARECMCGKAGGQRRDRSKRVHGVKTVEKNKYLTLWEGEMSRRFALIERVESRPRLYAVGNWVYN